MKIMVIGGGGREHAIIKKLKENKAIDKIYALPGNGGIENDAVCIPIGACEIDKIVDFASSEKIDYAVVAPDDPLVLGAVDRLEEIGIPCFGPRANAAIIEGSKAFSKELMKKYGIPTAEYKVFSDADAAADVLGHAGGVSGQHLGHHGADQQCQQDRAKPHQNGRFQRDMIPLGDIDEGLPLMLRRTTHDDLLPLSWSLKARFPLSWYGGRPPRR